MTDKLAKLDKEIGAILNSVDSALDTYNPGDVSKKNFLAGVFIAVHDNWQLQKALEADIGRASFVTTLKRAMSMGISLHPDDGQAGLAVFKGVVSLMPMKNLIIKRAMESGKVELIDCDTVREKDELEFIHNERGRDIKHSPARRGRGGIDGFYCRVELTSGKVKSAYMTVDEVEEHKEKYGNGKDKPEAAWNKSFEGMALKTIVKKLLRNLHVSDEVDRLIGTDDKSEAGVLDADFTVDESPAGAVAAKLQEKPETAKGDSPI